ncbi:MAG: SDR family NAD(P)-dependent oxidoreductase [Nannocystaceae bacterium]
MNARVKAGAVVQTPIAIVGIGCTFPRAPNLATYWANLRDGVDAIRDIPATHWCPDDYFDVDPKASDKTYAQRGGFLDPIDFEPMRFGIAPRDLEATDTTQLIGMHVAALALEDAGYGAGARAFDRDRTSVMIGVTGTLPLAITLGARLGHPLWRRALHDAGVDTETAEDVVARISEAYVPWQENSFPGLLGNVVAGRIANRLDLHGTNCVVDAACASSLSAIHLAVLELESGRADMALSGGVDTFNDPFMFLCFSKTPALSATGHARPFDEGGDGTILGEGAGIVVLKRLADAERDGDQVYAVIKGIGSSSDGGGHAIYAPDSEGQARALRAAHRMAGVQPGSIELLEGHGTGTRVGDAVEVEGLRSVFGEGGEGGSWCALGSVKSMIGHTKAAAGVAGLIKVVMSLKHRVLPPTIKVNRPNKAIAPGRSPFYLNTEKRPWLPRHAHPRRGGVSAFGFGGSNFHCVIEEYAAETAEIDWEGCAQILAFSADDREGLLGKIRAFDVAGSWEDLRGRAAMSRALWRREASLRLLLVIPRDGKAVAETMETAARLVSTAKSSFSTPQGIYFGSGSGSGSGNAAGTLGVIFPGQGSQYVGMLRDLICRFPVAAEVLAHASEESDGLAASIFPQPVFSEAERAVAEARLQATEVAQPAIGAVSLGVLRVLESFGLVPAATCGHSYGELTALCAAGRLEEGEFHRLSRRRGELMGDSTAAGDRGAMLAVQAKLDDVDHLISAHGLDLVIANRNTPSQAVLSGATSEIARAETTFAACGVRVKRLPVAAAFHSDFVAQAEIPFADSLASLALPDGKMPVYSNVTGVAYPTDPSQTRVDLARQVRTTVDFVRCIESMYADGVRTFVELGPGRRLSGLVAEILADRTDVAALSVDASSGGRPGDLDFARVLAQLGARGHAVALDRWDLGAAEAYQRRLERPAPTMTVAISGANHTEKRTSRPARPRHDPTSVPRAAPMPVPTEPPTPPTPPTSPTSPMSPSSSVLPSSRVSPSPIVGAVAAPLIAAQALQTSQENLTALIRLQEQTARLHQRFLESQQEATRSFHALVQQHQQLQWMNPVAASEVPATGVVATDGASAVASTGSMSPVATDVATDVSTDTATDVPVAAPAVVTPIASPRTAVADVLLEVVAEKTGYPAQMLELSMGLDADLGIDSIKRVEILSSLQQRLPGSPTIKPEHLGELRTLGEIVRFLDGGGAEASQPKIENPASVADGVDPIARTLLEVVATKTGYPAEMLELSMGLDADLGIDSIKRVEILSLLQERMPETPAIQPEHLGELRTLGQIVDFLAGRSGPRPDATPVQVSSPVPSPDAHLAVAKRSVRRLLPSLVSYDEVAAPVDFASAATIWVTDSGDGRSLAIVEALRARGLAAQEVMLAPERRAIPDDVCGLVLVAPLRMHDAQVLQAFGRVRQLASTLRRAGKGAASLLACVTTLGGGLGLDGLHGQADPETAGLAGIVKSASAEWPEVVCRVIDVDPDLPGVQTRIVDALLRRGPIELGLSAVGSRRVELREEAMPSSAAQRFDGEDVILITGGARGVTAEIAVAFARRGRPRLVLVGRSPEPAKEAQWLVGVDAEADIKRAIVERSAEPLTPRQLEAEYQRRMSARGIRRTLARIEEAGASVRYCCVDVRDRDAVAACVRHVSETLGPITGLVHGAGILADARIEDKTDQDFERVYATKVGGMRCLLGAIDRSALKVLVAFSSSTARFGRRGQTDYAAANEVLNKIVQREAKLLPGCRAISVNWGPWDGGMVTPALKRVFEGEGIITIDLEAGAAYLMAELGTPGPVEVVVLGAGSELPVVALEPPDLAHAPLPTVFERLVSVADHPFLASHVLDGHAVLPTVIVLEWLAHAALHGNPGLRFVGVDDLSVFKGVILDPGASFALRVCAASAQRVGDVFHVATELRSGGRNGSSVLHGRARVVLSSTRLTQGAPMELPKLGPVAASVSSFYATALFHGPTMRGLTEIEGSGDGGLVARCKSAPPPEQWMSTPVRGRWIADPLALDSGMQAVIVWSFDRAGQVSLPSRLGRYRQFVSSFPAAGIRVVVRVRKHNESRAVSDIEWVGSDGSLVARLEDYECVIDASLVSAFRRNKLAPAVVAPA